jgi:hypothetical protein
MFLKFKICPAQRINLPAITSTATPAGRVQLTFRQSVNDVFLDHAARDLRC